MGFNKLISEAKRISNVNNYLYKSNKQAGDANRKGGADGKPGGTDSN